MLLIFMCLTNNAKSFVFRAIKTRPGGQQERNGGGGGADEECGVFLYRAVCILS